ncbi:MAG: threonine--tRNA ligase [Candidatus Marinimicrobia bacterium]|nr:threonine--tRNA ligase [Candidatus Neomarinimicrobiota bacterium]MDP6229200.1 threonine--tRNA ligase [Candidatus Neomarinimicrobiota bacterium]MDP7094921.1 threonine--tRNA ligase [Candidatus Neomarinimicrobiota bacterium]MDP7166101.1 threonine--tRNA ligase [Candidatus Neomarinimicrobiota bacterium]
MSNITITFPDQSTRSFPSGVSTMEIAENIGPRLAKAAVATRINNELADLSLSIDTDAEIEIITDDSDAGHEVLLHSTAHLMAQAVKALFPDAKVTIGPAIENRFYYDFDIEGTFSDEDLEKIEAKMRELSESDFTVNRLELSRNDALKKFHDMGETYKVEIIEQIDEKDTISAYSQDDFIDLCRGPHVPSTGRIKHFKLLSTSGAYWRGDENNTMLQRIYGTAFSSKKGLDEYLHNLEEAKKRDHRKLGKELDLFFFHSLSPASPFFTDKGAVIYNGLVSYIRDLYQQYGYDEVISPQVFDMELWKQSGHYEMFIDNMFSMEMGEREFGLKPMNCPGHTLMYSHGLHSYRDLPIRMADFGRLHRFEKAGVLSGLTRVRSMAQDDAHIFCTPDQIGDEIRDLFEMVQKVYDTFNFKDLSIALSTRPEKALGEVKLWNKAESTLKDVLEKSNFEFTIDEGEGAFYGPKIDFHVKDALQRDHQLATIQLDFVLPERFKLKYIAEDGSEARPVMIHRAILGSLERFFGVYLEHCGGDFPLWLAPVQVTVLPVSDKVQDYAESVTQKLNAAGFRIQLDDKADKIGAKIRQAELSKINVMLIVGEKEAEAGTVSVRRRHQGDLGAMDVTELIDLLNDEIKQRSS